MLVILALPVGRRAIVSVDVADDSAFKLCPAELQRGNGALPSQGSGRRVTTSARWRRATIDHEGNERPIRAG